MGGRTCECKCGTENSSTPGSQLVYVRLPESLPSRVGTMAKILLVKPYQPAVCTGMSPPLGILYLASNLRENLGARVSVDVLDARLYSLRAGEVAHAARDADIVGLSAENL